MYSKVLHFICKAHAYIDTCIHTYMRTCTHTYVCICVCYVCNIYSNYIITISYIINNVIIFLQLVTL